MIETVPPPRHCPAPCVDGGGAWDILQDRWDRRMRQAAAWLANEPAVVDIGCGHMGLREHLAPTTRYVPVDIVDRGPGTVLHDLNGPGPLPVFGEPAAALLGVVEYVEDVPRLLTSLRQFDRVVLSYNHASVQDLLWRLGLRDKRVLWLHRHGAMRFAAMVGRAGWQITCRHRVRIGEAIYDLRRTC
ncbi:hypothetical protein [Novosphingobium sp.]|uniref:hypothetical protein n=1 Tax=Novosphingobium sp. TaxID=1874826 RepID=UPI002FDCD587